MINDFNERENYGGFGYSETPAPAPVSEERNNLSGVAKIKVIGVGGAGNNAVDRLIESGLQSAEYMLMEQICRRLCAAWRRKRQKRKDSTLLSFRPI